MERGWKEISPNCPRCGSTNTKFCYYNNYSLTQPRYFCKGCRRYWTKGGSLRNVPVGGGCRKSRRSRSSSSLRLATTTTTNNHLNDGNTNAMFGLGGHIGATNTNNNHLRHNSSSNSQASNIDIALVYANFLSTKPKNSNSNGVELTQIPKEFEEKSNEVALKQHVSSHSSCNLPGMEQEQQQQHESQGISRILPCMRNGNKDNHVNKRFIEEFSTTRHEANEQDHIITSMQHELGLPPLLGESSSSQSHC